MSLDLTNFLLDYQARVNTALDLALPSPNTQPAVLHQAMRYAVLGGGKRLRAMLTYASGEIFAADINILDKIAVAIELVHAYSLIHDDLPAMDNDDLRHGRPSCHRVFGEALAILTGDALQSLAFELLTTPCDNLPISQQLRMLNILAQAIGSLGMVGGQVLDIKAENRLLNLEALDTMHQKKTGALITASVYLGILAGDSPDPLQIEALLTFANKLGLAFQIQDDILDVEASTEILGKTQGSDQVHNKLTYPKLLGLQASKKRANELCEEGLGCLSKARLQSELLENLAKFAITRCY